MNCVCTLWRCGGEIEAETEHLLNRELNDGTLAKLFRVPLGSEWQDSKAGWDGVTAGRVTNIINILQ